MSQQRAQQPQQMQQQHDNPAPSLFDSVASIFGRGRNRFTPPRSLQPAVMRNSIPAQQMNAYDDDGDMLQSDPTRSVVTKALLELPLSKRHVLLGLLQAKGGPSFAHLFAYSGTADSHATAPHAGREQNGNAPTQSPEEVLRDLMKEARSMPEEAAAVVPAAPTVAGPAAPESTEPPLTLSLTPEWEEFSMEAGSETKPLRLVVSLKGASDVARSGNLAITMVNDRSGSMSGPRIELVKSTSHFLIDQLKPSDSMGFVSYQSAVSEDLPLVCASPAAKAYAHGVVDLMQAVGGTALHDGLIRGMKQQLELGSTADSISMVQAVLLATDGEANVGPRTADEILPSLHNTMKTAEGGPQSAISTHCFGIGHGHDARLLQAISESAHGSYYFIASVQDIPNAYGDCLGGMLAVVGKQITVQLTPLNGAKLVHVSAGGVVKREGDSTASANIAFADLFAQERRDSLVCLQLPSSGHGRGTSTPSATVPAPVEVLRADVRFVQPSTGELTQLSQTFTATFSAGAVNTEAGASPMVVSTAARFETAELLEKAQQLDEKGEVEAAKTLLDSHVTRLRERGAQSAPEAQQQLELFQAQTVTVKQSIATRTEETARMHFALHKSAARCLHVQRATNAGTSAILPTSEAYDNRSKAATRMRAQTASAMP